MSNWEQLQQQCLSCQGCPLCGTRTSVVFGEGRQDAQILFVGEGPGQQEDLQGRPFVGPAGQLLDEMLNILDLDRNIFYITNIVKCRPPQNRDPHEEEQDACIHFLEEQIRLIQPKILVCLGRIAAKRLISPDFRITREHGQWFERDGIHMTAFYHPSALLRDVSKRPDAFSDLMSLRAKMQELGIKY